ncbi:glycosyl hydrolase [Draconibacterium sp.]|nr:glycosyl hydrolase [Draconibacterium sp.]
MKRRAFISRATILSGGTLFLNSNHVLANPFFSESENSKAISLYSTFKSPALKYYPFVRWWWNGNKVEKNELIRELHLLKEAGIGGVEINPIEFPSRIEGDDLGIPSLRWLSDDWIEMLQVVFDEAKKLGMTCDLIVGSGWPFGSEILERNERAQVVILNAENLEGPKTFETSQFNLFKQVDPGVTVPNPARTFEILSLKLVPDPMVNLNQGLDISEKKKDEVIRVEVPEGKFVLYTLIKVDSFASVINGAPGAAGSILNHMDARAVRKYLDRMSDTIQGKTGPLSNHIRAFFSDSMELEGCNWTEDFPEEFEKRRGYDLMPYLPFILFKVGRLGGVINDKYGAQKSAELTEMLNRVRFDFEFTKAQILNERFTKTFLQWCNDQNVKSRAQAYGRGFFPLETSLEYDIPEGESWTTNWLKHKVGEEMPDDDYRRGRAYTMINKYVSSAAHLTGKRVVSCEEMTNTYKVFNTTLEQLKAGSDQSIISGITHSVWHGFNYSPPEAPYPGWIQYGSYYNEKNNWWPYFKYLNSYKARVSALLQNADMYTDIAILPANYDLWGEKGVQTDPFPEKLNVSYTSLLWEANNKNGGAADYTSEIIINNSEVKKGKLCYGPKKYGTIFLAEVTSINPETLEKLYEFVKQGGRIFCVEKYPEKSPGLTNYVERDDQVRSWIEKLKAFPERFILIKKPEDNRFMEWYADIMQKHNISNYMEIEKPNRFLMQNRYQANDKSEIFFFANVHLHNKHQTKIIFPKEITKGKNAWVWNPEDGDRNRIQITKDGAMNLNLGPAESRIIVFDKNRKGKDWSPQKVSEGKSIEITTPWSLEFKHCRGKTMKSVTLEKLQELKDIPDYTYFSGTIVYKTNFQVNGEIPLYLNIGKLEGVAKVKLNKQVVGIKWYGDKNFPIHKMVKDGENELEIEVTTLMGNYMKSLTENDNVQYWTNLKNKNQPLTSIGLIGPVIFYD